MQPRAIGERGIRLAAGESPQWYVSGLGKECKEHTGTKSDSNNGKTSTPTGEQLTNLYALVARSALLRNDSQFRERIRFLAPRSVNGGIGKDG